MSANNLKKMTEAGVVSDKGKPFLMLSEKKAIGLGAVRSEAISIVDVLLDTLDVEQDLYWLGGSSE